MGSEKASDVSPGWIDCWRLWRHCLCRFGWYPLFLAPLVTCACLLELYSSTGCDFIRLDIGFVPANGTAWSESRAHLGLFSSFDGDCDRIEDKNKWERSFNGGCRPYSEDFKSRFITPDRTWDIARTMAYISGSSSLVALATVWLLTITPLPASFFWPGVLLPATMIATLAGSARFFFFDAQICSAQMWIVDESAPPVAARSCGIGESSAYGISSAVAFFLCAVLIFFGSPQKRTLDAEFGQQRVSSRPVGSTISHQTGFDAVGSDLESEIERVMQAKSGDKQQKVETMESVTLDSQHTTKIKVGDTTPQTIERGRHTRTTSDVTWNVGPMPRCMRSLSNLSDASKISKVSFAKIKLSDGQSSQGMRSYSGSPPSSSQPRDVHLPPRHPTSQTRIVSTVPRDVTHQALFGTSTGSSVSWTSFSPDNRRANRSKQFNDYFWNEGHLTGGNGGFLDAKREVAVSPVVADFRPQKSPKNSTSQRKHPPNAMTYLPSLPSLDETSPTVSPTKSLASHGELIYKCVRDLQKSFDEV